MREREKEREEEMDRVRENWRIIVGQRKKQAEK